MRSKLLEYKKNIKQVTLRIPISLFNQIKRDAEAVGVTPSEKIRSQLTFDYQRKA